MADKKLIFMAVNMLITVFSLAIIIATMFIENQSKFILYLAECSYSL